MPLNLDEITATMSSLNDEKTDELKRALEKAQHDLQDPKNLLDLQAAMQKWTIANQMQSQLIKELGESLKGIISKMG